MTAADLRARVGFIGMGRMGRPMASRLLDANLDLVVYNRTASGCDDAVRAGAEAATSPRAVAQSCDVVFTMLSGGTAVEDVYLGADGLLAGVRPGAVFVEMSTIGPAAATTLATACREHGADMLDAPVSGSVGAAAAGALVVLVGGPSAALARVQPYLQAMSARQFHLGDSGSGAAAKLAINCLVAITNQAVSEALTLAGGYEIEREQFFDVLQSSALNSKFLDVKRSGYLCPDDADVLFTTRMMLKDVDLAGALAAGVGVPLPATAATARTLRQACAAGLAEHDFSSVAVLLDSAKGNADIAAALGTDFGQ